MRFIAFKHPSGPRLGLRLRDDVVDLTAAGLPATLDALIAQGAGALESARTVAERSGARMTLEEIEYLPPLRHPSSRCGQQRGRRRAT